MSKKQIVAALLVFSSLVFSAYAIRINFTKADKDGDGKLTKEEFVAEFEKINPATAKEASMWFSKNDLNQDGVITPEEFAPPKK